MKSWMDFYDYYLAQIPGCTYFAAQNALRMAAQEFCDKAKVWRVTMDPVITIAGVSIYDFDLTSDQELVKILSAKIDGQPIDPLDDAKADAPCVQGVLALNPREFMLRPDSDPGMSLVLRVALKPSNTARGVEDWIYGSYAEQIAAGAKARLMAETGKPYTDASGAGLNREIFDTAIAAAATKSAKAYSSAPLRTRPSFF